MSSELKHRRGTAAAHASFIGAQGEITVKTDTNEIVVHDGVTPGGKTGGGYMPAGTGAVATTVQSKLREFVSVKDFGAVGDGVTDDTVAIQAALDFGGDVFLTPGKTFVVRRATAVGDYNAALVIKKSNTRLVIPASTTLKLDANQNCCVIRSAMPGLGEVASRLQNISIIGGGTIDGNWGNQTWAGPDGSAGGSVTVYDQDGIQINEVDGAVLEINVKKCAQDGITCASSTAIEVFGGSAKNCGKGNLTFFLCENFTVHGGEWENPNDSPDGGVSKPYYTISSEGYAALGCAYKPDVAWSTGRNAGAFIAPKIKVIGSKGRGISVINTLDLDIVSPDIKVTGDTQAFTIGVQNDGVPGDTENVKWIGGTITRSGQTANQRIGTVTSATASSLFTRDVTITGLWAKSYGSFSSSLALVDVKGKTDITNVKLAHGAAASAVTFDVRGCDAVSVANGSITGTVSFNTSTTAEATVVGLDMGGPLVGTANVTLLKSGHTTGDTEQELDASYSRIGAGINAGVTESTNVTVTGAAVGDFVLLSHTNPTNADIVQSWATVTATDTVALRIRNNSASVITVGSGTWYFKVIKRGRKVL